MIPLYKNFYSIRKKSCREATKTGHAISRRSPLEFQMFCENRAKAGAIYHDKYYCHRYSLDFTLLKSLLIGLRSVEYFTL